MKKNLLKRLMIYLTILSVFFQFVRCDEKDELPPFHAKGEIFLITSGCYGEVVYIEVDEPHGIGSKGDIYITENEKIHYSNAIGVPYFSKIAIPDSVPCTDGTTLYFEYRVLAQEEKEDVSLFFTDTPIVCPANIAPHEIERYIIKKIIIYK